MQNGLYVVMGVAGSGKSLIGSAFAASLHLPFVDGDDFHPRANVRKMAAGIPLTDADRAGWLDALNARLRDSQSDGGGLVMACSALKRSYRDVLRSGVNDLQFIFLRGPSGLIAARLESRRGHYMPPSLLDSQFATLEEPAADEHAWVADIRNTPAELVAELTGMARS